ncbi:hypothetical protein [Frateuria terrea]|uniref:SmpA / OmlA family protein n=1 Tax=Frateuria terrea TaxID=529704 RepID=A0A1H6UIQ6_9GAMM|nr:hypothetical protein SAMN04487997_2046 [Frateuria terrea]SFP35500.1 hypothetical protein SAMN02927913_1681 [Frateuria terrea]
MVKFTGGLAMLAAIAFGAPMAAHAGDSLLIHRVQQEQGMNLPTRGMTMAQVEKRFGAPQRKLQPRGGDTRKHPVINRWDYSTFIVYFEHDHVIHSVLNTPAGNNHNPATTQ